MCGVAGIFDLAGERAVDRAALRRMTEALAHRGPDGQGYHFAPGVGFGHTRLAIIDKAGGAQPFVASDGKSVLCYNGELYNYRDLQGRLSAGGVALKTRSDTEAAAEMLLAKGEAAIENFRGMFAFAWFDGRTRRLTLARDRFGEKPLYYAVSSDGFLHFASEIGAVLAAGVFARDYSHEALHDYFLLGYVPDPKSVYRNIFKLPAASILTAERGEDLAVRKYWRAEFSPDSGLTAEAARRELLDLLDDAVAAQMQSDAALGAFLSGGVDSSAVVASMARSGAEVSTWTIGFDDASFDERSLAAATARRYATTHHAEPATIDASGMIDRIAAIFGEPFADSSAIPVYMMSGVAGKRVKVALSGDGGDEIFGGYRRYRFFAAEEAARRFAPCQLRRSLFGVAGAVYPKLDWAPRALRLKTTLQSLGETAPAAYARAVSTILPDRLDALLSDGFRSSLRDYGALSAIDCAYDPSLDPVSAAQKIDLETWLPGRMLTKLDRASMAHGLEVRAPFLDHKLAEWAFRLPAALKANMRRGKIILKAAMEERLDRKILYGGKRGFAPPIAAWLRKPAGPIDRLRQSDSLARTGFFSAGAVNRMIERHSSGTGDYSQELWSLIMFDAFLRVEDRRAASPRPADASEDFAA